MKLKAVPYMGFSLALFLAGCPKRQAPTRIVYVPAPPPAVAPLPSAGAAAIVIEEPEPPPAPEPSPALPPPAASPQPERRHRHVPRSEQQAPPAADTPDMEVAPPPAQVPSLEPLESSSQEAALRREIQGLQDDVRQRIAKLDRAGLSGVDRKTLDDARAFFAQSTQALKEADLQRALTLARKASLLVSALER